MNPERWRVVTEIFHAALERPTDLRSSYLVQACGQDRSLRADVDALLAGDARAAALGDPLTIGHAALSPGSILGPYRVEALLGAGGMGEVYKAHDTRLKRDVAIKVLPPGVSADPDRLARFEREAHAAAALNHPNICAVFDIGMHDGAPFIVSELLEGETLRQVCAAGPLTLRRALEYAVPIARGLAAAHGKGIVHRDLKPENVFITTEGRVKILDFGLAKLMTALADEPHLATRDPLTEVGIVLGTIGYMSPEQVRGLPADSRSDIFSFGTVLFEMLAGRPPFRGDTDGRYVVGDSARRSAGADAAGRRAASARTDRPSLPREGAAEPFSVGGRSRLRARGRDADVDQPRRRPRSMCRRARARWSAGRHHRSRRRWRSPWPRRGTRVAPTRRSRRVPVHAVCDRGRRDQRPRVVAGWPQHRLCHGREQRSQIFVRSLDSDSPAQITHGPDDAARPFWWPDGSRVGFVSA